MRVNLTEKLNSAFNVPTSLKSPTSIKTLSESLHERCLKICITLKCNQKKPGSAVQTSVNVIFALRIAAAKHNTEQDPQNYKHRQHAFISMTFFMKYNYCVSVARYTQTRTPSRATLASCRCFFKIYPSPSMPLLRVTLSTNEFIESTEICYSSRSGAPSRWGNVRTKISCSFPSFGIQSVI